jgi:hypothetical protein
VITRIPNSLLGGWRQDRQGKKEVTGEVTDDISAWLSACAYCPWYSATLRLDSAARQTTDVVAQWVRRDRAVPNSACRAGRDGGGHFGGHFGGQIGVGERCSASLPVAVPQPFPHVSGHLAWSRRLLAIDGMQEARGSSPLSSTAAQKHISNTCWVIRIASRDTLGDTSSAASWQSFRSGVS